jgi:hypothetical protein
MRKTRRLLDTYRFPGFRPEASVHGMFGDPMARVVSLRRLRKKRLVAPVGTCSEPSTITSRAASATCPVATPACSWSSRFGACNARSAAP